MTDSPADSGVYGAGGWYDLFSRGARDWLRHNDKVREAIHRHLPEMIAGGDIVGGASRSVRVPVRFLQHHHFRLLAPGEQQGVGQGAARPGDQLVPAQPGGSGSGKGAGGDEEGMVEFLLEFKVDDIVDWLWEELKLPNLEPRRGSTEDTEWTREGWDRRGVRSRLDRRRSLRESIKRRGRNEPAPALVDEDLRFRQLARRPRPATQAVVFMVLDVSGSMSESDRKLAKSFFFWAVQGLRRAYRQLATVFVGHTTEAWEFSEEEFFRVSASGGTIASSAFRLVRDVIDERYNPSQHNVYLFYASDGDNLSTDREAAASVLGDIAAQASYCGYLEVSGPASRQLETETGRLFEQLAAAGHPVGSFAAVGSDDIWAAIRHFLSHESAAGKPQGAG